MGEPARVQRLRLRVALAHEVADPLGIDPLARLEGPGGAAREPPQEVPQLVADDALAEQLVGQAEVGEEVVVEEVAERAVADIVQQPGHPHQLLDQRHRRRVGELRLERRVELAREAPRQVHGAEGVLEAAVLGGREDPARGLQLRHAPEALHPRRVDQVLLGRLARRGIGPRIEDVPVDGIGDEAAALVGVDAFHGGCRLGACRRNPLER